MDEDQIPAGHTGGGGVLVGSDGARRRLIVYEDMQCPYCREFEERCGDLLRREVAAGAVSVEYRIRSFLGDESVRAANALAVAAGAGVFDQLRREVFRHQPPERTGGFATEDLLELSRTAGIRDPDDVVAIRTGRFEPWVREIENEFVAQDLGGTPFVLLDDQPIDSSALYDPEILGAVIRE